MHKLKRGAIHEAGHFSVAYRYNPRRAVSICVGSSPAVDAETGAPYSSFGQTVTWDLDGSLPGVLVAIRAAGLAAESLIYEEPYEHLMSAADVNWVIKTDLDNAKQDLYRNGLLFGPNDPTFPEFWRMGFSNAMSMLQDSEDELHAIADYCIANLGREIPRAELVANIGL